MIVDVRQQAAGAGTTVAATGFVPADRAPNDAMSPSTVADNDTGDPMSKETNQ